MADYITKIRTTDGDKQIDYNALANKPDLSLNGLGAAASSHNHSASNITSGTLSVARGGTGKASWTANRLMYPSASTTMSQLAFPTVNQSVLCQNTSGAPYWSKASVIDTSNISEVLLTSSVDVSDNWLLCNGDSINYSDYPAYCATSTASVNPTYRNVASGTYSVNTIDIVHGGGKWVALCRELSNYKALIQIYDSTSATTASVQHFGSYNIVSIAYGGGTWAMIGYDQSYNGTYIWYTTNPSGTWTRINSPITGFNTSNLFMEIRYCNSSWVVMYNKTIYYSSSITGSWTSKVISTSTANFFLADIVYADSLYVAMMTVNSSGVNNATYIYTATSLSGTWTARSSLSGMLFLNKLLYADGVWVVVGSKYDSTNRPFIATATDPKSTWTANTSVSDIGGSVVNDVVYTNGTWIAVGGSPTSNSAGRFLATTDPREAWLYKDSDTYGSYAIQCIDADSTGIFLALAFATGGTNVQVFTNSKVNLPTLSYDSLYAYIKVKE